MSIHERREHILQESQPPLRNPGFENIALSIFKDRSSPGPPSCTMSVRSAPKTKHTYINIFIYDSLQ